MQNPDNLTDNFSKDRSGARSAKKWMGYLLAMMFLILAQLYRLDFLVHSDPVHPDATKKAIFLILAIQLFAANISLDFFYNHKYRLAKIISMIVALLGIVSVFIIVFIPEIRALSN